MGCTYCYNELSIKDRKGSDVPEGMTWDIAKAAIDTVIAQATKASPISILYIGGEPLLERQLLFDSVAYAKAECAKAGLAVKFTVYTNGTLMTDRVIEWAGQNRVSLVVSLDGPPAMNDASRIFLSGRPTGKVVLRNIRRLVESEHHRILRVRAVSQPHTPLVALHRYLLALGFNEIHVQPMYDEGGISSANPGEMLDLLDWWKERLLAGQIISIMPFDNYFQKILMKGRSTGSWYPCKAGRNAITVGPDGRIYSCHHAMEEPDYQMGHIKQGLPIAEIRSSYYKRGRSARAVQVVLGAAYLRRGMLPQVNFIRCWTI
jgi:uncharacterized protein